MKDKIETYIGFCVKSRKTVTGINALEAYKKKLYCILVCNTLSENSLNLVKKINGKFNVPIIKVCAKSLEQISFIQGCKVLALTDLKLSSAVIENLNENYEIIEGLKTGVTHS
ncbi:MAG: hypothetical protein FWG51_02075 [Firmicutes bacterium]|nr:hypothetical protein [Bacillota bacterium]